MGGDEGCEDVARAYRMGNSLAQDQPRALTLDVNEPPASVAPLLAALATSCCWCCICSAYCACAAAAPSSRPAAQLLLP